MVWLSSVGSMSVREQNGVTTMPSPFEDTARLGERAPWDGAKGELLEMGTWST